MVNGLSAGARPFCAWENYETIRGISNPAFKVDLRQHLMWNHSKVVPLLTSCYDPWAPPTIRKKSRLKCCNSCQEYPTQVPCNTMGHNLKHRINFETWAVCSYGVVKAMVATVRTFQ